MKKQLIFIFILVLAVIGCKKSTTAGDDLLKIKWTLSYIQDTKTNTITNYPDDAARKISIIFTDSLNVISFYGICNGGGGTYSYSSSTGELKITGLCTTKIYCKYSEWETYTVQNLYTAICYKIVANNLAIYSTGPYSLYFIKE